MSCNKPITLKSPRLLIGLAFVLSLAVALSGWTLDQVQHSPTATEELLGHVKFLTSAELTGRGVDTPGIKLARDYLAVQFGKSGLRGGGEHGDFFQPFDVTVGVTVADPSSLMLDHDPPLKLNDEWIPLGLSTSDQVAAEVVFAGYGVTARDYGYDDYAQVGVKGKIALVLRYEPPPKDAKSPFKKSPDASRYSALRTKANNARDHGAVGMILVDLNQNGDAQSELLSTKNSLWRGGNSLVAVQVKRRVIERWLDSRGISLRALK
jgi:hypothetical protein